MAAGPGGAPQPTQSMGGAPFGAAQNPLAALTGMMRQGAVPGAPPVGGAPPAGAAPPPAMVPNIGNMLSSMLGGAQAGQGGQAVPPANLLASMFGGAQPAQAGQAVPPANLLANMFGGAQAGQAGQNCGRQSSKPPGGQRTDC